MDALNKHVQSETDGNEQLYVNDKILTAIKKDEDLDGKLKDMEDMEMF